MSQKINFETGRNYLVRENLTGSIREVFVVIISEKAYKLQSPASTHGQWYDKDSFNNANTIIEDITALVAKPKESKPSPIADSIEIQKILEDWLKPNKFRLPYNGTNIPPYEVIYPVYPYYIAKPNECVPPTLCPANTPFNQDFVNTCKCGKKTLNECKEEYGG